MSAFILCDGTAINTQYISMIGIIQEENHKWYYKIYRHPYTANNYIVNVFDSQYLADINREYLIGKL